MASAALLDVSNLSVGFVGDDGRVTPAVTGVSFQVRAGRTLGVVGESGCGKSVTALSLMRLLPKGTARVTGSIRFGDQDLLALPEAEMRGLRGNRLAMIFQEPMTSLNPSFTVGDQIGEALRCHRQLDAKQARLESIALLRQVRIPSPEQRVDEYPHKLSGGMRQRVMIAMALACRPALLIADEPTTALDVTIQAQVLDLLRNLAAETGASILFITHDLGVVAELCDDVIVMYAGEIVEQATVAQLFEQPQHPYTIGLLGALPRLTEKRDRLTAIRGMVPKLTPQLTDVATGCRFATRCPFVVEQCRREAPPLAVAGDGHLSRCWRTPLEALVA
jgi:peptide/nickel transport system ATP-binding protein